MCAVQFLARCRRELRIISAERFHEVKLALFDCRSGLFEHTYMVLLPIVMVEGFILQTRSIPIYFATATLLEVFQPRFEAASAYYIEESELVDE